MKRLRRQHHSGFHEAEKIRKYDSQNAWVPPQVPYQYRLRVKNKEIQGRMKFQDASTFGKLKAKVPANYAKLLDKL